MLACDRARARRSSGVRASPPSRRSKTTRGLVSMGIGVVGVRHDSVFW